MLRNLIFNTDFKNFIIPGNFQEFSGTLDIAWNWPIFCQFCHIGHLFHLIFVTELEFGLNDWKMPNSRLFLESWNQNPKITRDNSKTWHFSFIPYMLKLVKTNQFQGTFGILESWIPGSRNHDISQNVRKINTNMLHRLVFKKSYQQPSKKAFFWKVA